MKPGTLFVQVSKAVTRGAIPPEETLSNVQDAIHLYVQDLLDADLTNPRS